ncbi:hypothetical protein H6769_02570 [Candidatus Peribacteria bacterium]|nr:hypothetical protein [Candidatus Peribacteria bacterium]
MWSIQSDLSRTGSNIVVKILRSNPNKTVTNEVINLAADLIRANLRLKQIPFSQLPLELLIQERCFGKNDGTIVPVAPSGNNV